VVRTALVTVSGPGDDPTALAALRAQLARGPFVEVDAVTVPGEQALLRAKLRVLADAGGVDLVLTVGGIGLDPRHRVPEATLESVERLVPGLAEAMRAALSGIDPAAPLARGVAGVRRGTLVVNLPERSDAAVAALAAIAPALVLAVESIRPAGEGAPDAGRGDGGTPSSGGHDRVRPSRS
jgi:molybdopterin adenylyltransferase